MYTSTEEPASTAGFPALAQRLETYLADELTAGSLYRLLAEMVGNEAVRGHLDRAARDEEKHYRLLCPLYRRLTGRHPRAQPREVTFASPQEGLLTAIESELKAYEAYKDEYQRLQDRTLRQIFFELFSDSLGHAVRWNAALHILSGPA